MLRFYAARFPTVEVNNSFYRIPNERVLTTWTEQVPDQFRFVLKASRRITHNARLADEDGSLEYFLRAVNPLGERLGPTLFQLPPTFKKDLNRLQHFLERLPGAGRPRWSFATLPGSMTRYTSCSGPGTSPSWPWTRTNPTAPAHRSCPQHRGVSPAAPVVL